MRRKFSAHIALVGVVLGLFLGSVMPLAQAQTSLLPTDTTDNRNESAPGFSGITKPETCDQLRDELRKNPKALEGNELALKIRCGRIMLADLPYYFQYAISFVFNIIGTLAVIAVIRAGYIFMLSKDKEYADGRKAVLQVLIGLLVAALSFTAAQLVLRALFAVQNVPSA